MSSRSITPEVAEVGKIRIVGTLTGNIWFERLRYKTKKGKPRPHLLAINLFGKIVYWYRPREIKDPQTDRIIGYERRFDSDILQKSYDQIADFFGCSEAEAKDAVVFLEMYGLITREVRKVGPKKISRLYLRINPEELERLNDPFVNYEKILSKNTTSQYEVNEWGQKSDRGQKSTPRWGQKSTPSGVRNLPPTKNTNTKNTFISFYKENGDCEKKSDEVKSEDLVFEKKRRPKDIEEWTQFLKNDDRTIENVARKFGVKIEDVMLALDEFVQEKKYDTSSDDWKDIADMRKHFLRWCSYKNDKKRTHGTNQKRKGHSGPGSRSGSLVSPETAIQVFEDLMREGI